MASDQLRSPEVFPQKPGFPRILARDLAGENLRAVLDGGPGGCLITLHYQSIMKRWQNIRPFEMHRVSMTDFATFLAPEMQKSPARPKPEPGKSQQYAA